LNFIGLHGCGTQQFRNRDNKKQLKAMQLLL
jgi:hypothetical protein